MKSERIISWAVVVLLGACGGPTPTSDGGGPGPDAGLDGGEPFDPSVTYPGEGDPCEFSMLCGELQICVDSTCARHERFTADDLMLGTLARISPEILVTSSLYEGGVVAWDEYQSTGYWFLGGVIPGSQSSVLLTYIHDATNVRCPIITYGAGPPVVRVVDGIACTVVAISPQGHLLLGGPDIENGSEENPSKLMLVGPDGEVIFEGNYPADVGERVALALGDPDARAFPMTSALWHRDRFYFSGAAGRSAEVLGEETMPYFSVPARPPYAFFGEVTLDGRVSIHSVAGTDAQEGSYGWLVQEGGSIRSLMTEFEATGATRDVRITVMDLMTGERTPLLTATDGLGSTARYSQPSDDRWMFAAFPYPTPCEAALFDNGVRIGTIPWAYAPDDYHCDASGWDWDWYSYFGAGDSGGPAFIGHPQVPWVSRTQVTNAGVVEDELYAGDAAPWVPRAESGGAHFPPLMQGISRFAKTVELLGIMSLTDHPLGVWEARLSRRMP